MEYLPIVYDLAKYYAFFCLVTSICIIILNIKPLYRATPPLGVVGSISYVLTTFFMSFAFAPAFFIIIIFYSDIYALALEETLNRDEE